jgi:hypothetical protein
VHGYRNGYRDRCRRAQISDEMQSAMLGHGAASVTRGYGRVGLRNSGRPRRGMEKARVARQPESTMMEERVRGRNPPGPFSFERRSGVKDANVCALAKT